MQNLIIAINCVLPVFIVICTGALVRYSGKVPPEIFPKLSTMAFHFLLPCMLFNSIYQTDLSISFDPALIGYLMAFTLIWFGVGFVLCWFLVPDHRARGAFIQSFYRSNIAIVGISMADSMTGSEGVAAISMVIATIIPIYNILAVVTLEVCRGGKVELRPTLVGIAKNPLIIGCITGLVFLMLGITLPASVEKAVSQLGTAGSVITLLTLGASFQLNGVRQNIKRVAAANIIRLVIAPFLSARLSRRGSGHHSADHCSLSGLHLLSHGHRPRQRPRTHLPDRGHHIIPVLFHPLPLDFHPEAVGHHLIFQFPKRSCPHEIHPQTG